MAGATWKFILARAKDLANLGELTQARDRQLSVTLNQAGSLSFNIPMDDDLGQLIYPHEYAVKAVRFGSTGPKTVWSGYVNTVDEDVPSNKMTVNCVGWYDRLGKRLLMKDMKWEDKDDGQIAQDLLAHANADLATGEFPSATTSAPMSTNPNGTYVVKWPTGSSPNTPTWLKWGGRLPNEGRNGSTPYVDLTTVVVNDKGATAARTIPTVNALGTTVQAQIQSLSDLEYGYDWWIDPTTREFFVFRRRSVIRPEVVFGYGFGPTNVAAFGRQIDGSTLANFGVATASSLQAQGYQDDQGSQERYGPFEELYSLSSAPSVDILRYYVVGEIALKYLPRQIYSITPFNWTTENSTPEPFVEYDLGDQVAFVARQLPRISINQQVRVFSVSVAIDAEGNEKLGQLQIALG